MRVLPVWPDHDRSGLFNQLDLVSSLFIETSSLLKTRSLYPIEKEPPKKNKSYTLEMDFDFPEWIKKENSSLDQFKKKITYKINTDVRKVNFIRSEMISLFGKDRQRAFARYLARCTGRSKNDLLEKSFERLGQRLRRCQE